MVLEQRIVGSPIERNYLEFDVRRQEFNSARLNLDTFQYSCLCSQSKGTPGSVDNREDIDFYVIHRTS